MNNLAMLMEFNLADEFNMPIIDCLHYITKTIIIQLDKYMHDGITLAHHTYYWCTLTIIIANFSYLVTTQLWLPYSYI